MINQKPKIIVVLGPTASGKSALAVKIALRLNSGQAKKFGIKGAEIISADSRQVYKGLDIGTEKIAKKEMKGVKHHLIDAVNPRKIYTVVQYQKAAQKILKQIFKKRKIPIICGGSGLYIDALLYNYQLPAVAPQKGLREQLEKKSTKELFEMLQGIDPERAASIDRYNPRRLIRALEIVIKTGKPVPKIEKQSPYQILKIGLKKTPNKLRQLINQRLGKTLKKGLIGEIKKLRQSFGPAQGKQGLSWERLEELGLEYRLAADYLRGLISYEQMTEQMKKEIYRYAKRQMTWFKRDKDIHWIAKQSETYHLVKKFLLL